MGTRDKSSVVRVIAVFRLLKAFVLILIGANAPRLLDPGARGRLARWAADLPYVSQHGALQHVVAALAHLPRRRVEEVTVAVFAYALLFIVEGTGLWLGRVWAEYLTIVATASFIPFELYEVMKKTSVLRVATLVLNIAILIYLIVRRARARRSL